MLWARVSEQNNRNRQLHDVVPLLAPHRVWIPCSAPPLLRRLKSAPPSARATHHGGERDGRVVGSVHGLPEGRGRGGVVRHRCSAHRGDGGAVQRRTRGGAGGEG